jgi:hypothetical protein
MAKFQKQMKEDFAHQLVSFEGRITESVNQAVSSRASFSSADTTNSSGAFGSSQEASKKSTGPQHLVLFEKNFNNSFPRFACGQASPRAPCLPSNATAHRRL